MKSVTCYFCYDVGHTDDSVCNFTLPIFNNLSDIPASVRKEVFMHCLLCTAHLSHIYFVYGYWCLLSFWFLDRLFISCSLAFICLLVTTPAYGKYNSVHLMSIK